MTSSRRRKKKEQERKRLYFVFASIFICLIVVTTLFFWDVPYRVGFRLPLELTDIWLGKLHGIDVYIDGEYQETVNVNYDEQTPLYSQLSYDSDQEIELEAVVDTDGGPILLKYVDALPTYAASNSMMRELLGLPPRPVEHPEYHSLRDLTLWQAVGPVIGGGSI